MYYINRTISLSITKAINHFPVITIMGPRQSGKTTLCKHHFKDYTYINLEDISIRELIMSDIKRFINSIAHGLIIDEVHYLPELFSVIQVAVDENPQRRFVLTGSSNFSMLENITQSLAGRVAIFTLLPFSLQEIKAQITDLSTETILFNGFYPAIYAKKTHPSLLYQNYLTTYVERDIHRFINLRNVRHFQVFLRLVAGRVGSECNALSLSNQVGVSATTISEWITILEASYILFRLPPYFENLGKRLVKTPKLYFYDVGLLSFLLDIENESHLFTHPLKGGIFENMIIGELYKSRFNENKTPNYYFYRDNTQKEVDVLQLFGNQMSLFEIKSSQTFHKDFLKSIHYLKKLFLDRVLATTLIYDGNEEFTDSKDKIINFRNM